MIQLPIGDFEFGIGVFRIGDWGFRIEDWEKKILAKHQSPIQNHHLVINRPGVAGAVLQSPPSLID